MNPNLMLPVHDFEGTPSFVVRSQLIKMCSTYQTSSFIKKAKQGDHKGMVEQSENGFKGFDSFTDAKLVSHWESISENYHSMSINKELIREDSIDFLRASPNEYDDVEFMIKRYLIDTTYDPDIVRFTLSDWQTQDERDPSLPADTTGQVKIHDKVITLLFSDGDVTREVAVEMQDNVIRALIYGVDEGAPVKVEVPSEGPINVDMHDYKIEHADLIVRYTEGLSPAP